MTIHYTDVWGGCDLEQIFINILQHPDDYHVYDCSKEYDIGDVSVRPMHSDPQFSNRPAWESNSEFMDVIHRLEKLYQRDPTVRDRCYWFIGISDQDTVYQRKFPRITEFLTPHYVWDTFLFKQLHKHRPMYYRNVNCPKSSLLVSLMNRPHPHRQSAYIALKELGLTDNNQITWCNLARAWGQFCDQFLQTETRYIVDRHQNHVPDYCNQILKDCQTMIRKSWQTLYVADDDWDLLPGYDHSLFDVVVESTIDYKFYTEKTFRAILHGKPFVILAGSGDNTEFKKHGFELFDEYFDLSQDYNPDLPDSVHMAGTSRVDYKEHYKKILTPLCDLDASPSGLADLKQKTQAKVDHNLSVAVNMMFSDDYMAENIYRYDIVSKLATLDKHQCWYTHDTGLDQIRDNIINTPHLRRFVPEQFLS